MRKQNELQRELHNAFIQLNEYGGRADAAYIALFMCPDDLTERYGFQRPVEAAEEMLDSELPRLSREFTELFQAFNDRYFGGKLPKYRVEVRYTVRADRSSIDWRGQAIRIPVSSEPLMVARLLAGMARIATRRSNPTIYQKELFRLQEAGAPLWVPKALQALPAHQFIDEFTRVVNGVQKAATQ
jgi:hypothetical protein